MEIIFTYMHYAVQLNFKEMLRLQRCGCELNPYELCEKHPCNCSVLVGLIGMCLDAMNPCKLRLQGRVDMLMEEGAFGFPENQQ